MANKSYYQLMQEIANLVPQIGHYWWLNCFIIFFSPQLVKTMLPAALILEYIRNLQGVCDIRVLCNIYLLNHISGFQVLFLKVARDHKKVWNRWLIKAANIFLQRNWFLLLANISLFSAWNLLHKLSVMYSYKFWAIHFSRNRDWDQA